MVSPWLIASLAFGVILAELSLRHSGHLKLQPLAYLFVVILWPVILPTALAVVITLLISKKGKH